MVRAKFLQRTPYFASNDSVCVISSSKTHMLASFVPSELIYHFLCYNNHSTRIVSGVELLIHKIIKNLPLQFIGLVGKWHFSIDPFSSGQ
jgi:hypothetical protein